MMKHTVFALVVSLLLTLCLVTSLSACADPAADILAYQSRRLHLRIAYDMAGTAVEAELLLGEGGADRDMTLTILSPTTAAGITFTREGKQFSSSRDDLTIPTEDLSWALAPLAFFTIPDTAHVSNVTRSDSGGRIVTLTQEDTVWQIHFRRGQSLPRQITISAPASFRSVTILENLSKT